MSEARRLIENKKVIIGGSAGSFRTIIKLLKGLEDLEVENLILALHRPRKGNDKLYDVFCHNCDHELIEPKDGERVRSGLIYLAPSNSHLLVMKSNTFRISQKPAPYFSKPSIDLLFESAAEAWKDSLTGILLSGANEDGANGLSQIKKNGGKAIIQDPKDCLIDTMPRSAKAKTTIDAVLSSDQIIDLFRNSKSV